MAGIADTIYDTTEAFVNVCISMPGYGEECNEVSMEEYAYFVENEMPMYIEMGYTIEADTMPETYDTMPYFYAVVGELTSNTTYVVEAQSVCGEENLSRWTSGVEFTTMVDCDLLVDLPYVEGFEDNSMHANCWTIIA